MGRWAGRAAAWATAHALPTAYALSAPRPFPGFKQYCTPVLLTPGWHSVAIKYANSPATLGGASVLRLFVIDAEQAREPGGHGRSGRHGQ